MPEGFSDRAQLISMILHSLVQQYMDTYFPTKAYELDVFESFSGEDDWIEPIAANLSIDGLTHEGREPYGLCDAGISAAQSQAEYMFSQIRADLELSVAHERMTT